MTKLLPLTLSVLAIACGNPPVTQPHLKDESKNVPSASDRMLDDSDVAVKHKAHSSQNDELVSVPNNVSGALLACAIASDPLELGPEITVGCRFENQGGERVPANAIAKLSVFSFVAPKNSQADISVKPLTDTSVYDVAYFFKAKTKEESEAVAKATTVKVAFKDLLDGKEDHGLSVEIGTVLKVAIAIIKGLQVVAKVVYAVVTATPEDLLNADRDKDKDKEQDKGNDKNNDSVAEGDSETEDDPEDQEAKIRAGLKAAEAFFKKIFAG